MTDTRVGRCGARRRPRARGVPAQRRALLHRHGRHAGGRRAGGAGRTSHPHGGRAARHARAAHRAAQAVAPRARAARRSATPWRSALPALRERIARHYAERYGVAVAPERVVVTTGSSAGFRAGLPGAVRCRRQGGAAVAGLSLLPPYPDRARPERRCCSRPMPRSRWMPTAAQIDDGGAARAARRPGRRQPRQSDRHHAGARPAGRDRRRLQAQRHLARLRRDLSRPHLRHAGGDGARPQRRRRRRQQLLEILLHDRLARRLAGRAAGAGAAHRAAGAEPLHLAAGRGPGCGARRLRRPR